MYVASSLRRCNLRSCENFLDSALPRSLFLSETLEKITFNPGLSGKLLLILENELETSLSSSAVPQSYIDKTVKMTRRDKFQTHESHLYFVME